MDPHYFSFPMIWIQSQSQIDSIGRFLIILFAALVLLAFCIVYFGPSRPRTPIPDQERDPLLVP